MPRWIVSPSGGSVSGWVRRQPMPWIALWTSLLVCLPAPLVWAQAASPTTATGWLPVAIAAVVPTIGLVAFAVRADERGKRHDEAIVQLEERLTTRIEEVYTRTGAQIAEVAALVRAHVTDDHAPHATQLVTVREVDTRSADADRVHASLDRRVTSLEATRRSGHKEDA